MFDYETFYCYTKANRIYILKFVLNNTKEILKVFGDNARLNKTKSCNFNAG